MLFKKKMTTIKQSLQAASQKLKKTSETPLLDAEVILSYVLKTNRTKLFADLNKPLTKGQNKKFQVLINRRKKYEPVAYIIKQKEFYGLNFYINKRVLIPRPETEILIECVLKYQNTNSKPKVLLDIGIGSGCIAVTLAKYIPNIKIYASDISKAALNVAKINAKKHKVINKITFLKGNLLNPFNEIQKFKADIIVANLPYLSFEQYKKTKPDLKFEPKKALYTTNKGLGLYKKLLQQSPIFLKNNGKIFLEINPEQLKEIKKETKKHFPKAKFITKKDLKELNRVIIIFT